MKRLFTRHIVTYFLPTTFLVFLTFVSFWIPNHAVPARIALVLTNFLSICVILRGAASVLPNVDYITPLEVYLITSITFILLVMVEYVLVMKEVDFSFCSCSGSMEKQVLRVQELKSSPEQVQDGVERPPMSMVTEEPKAQTNINTIDRYSRILLPLSYILFIVLYFLYYLKHL